MARFHLPLASTEETVYRATSMFLLAQYFAYRVNRAMAERLRSASEQDAAVNAIVILDLLAKALPDAILDSLTEVRHLFSSYLK
jgi:hypothetical protein